MNPYHSPCDDFYINMRLGSQIALPQQRETILHYFEQLQRSFPAMSHFRKGTHSEFHLEEDRAQPGYRWTGLEARKLTAGHVNPDSVDDAMQLHTKVLQLAPHLLGISPVEIDHLDVMFGFDLEYRGNHDEIISQSLLSESPLNCLSDVSGARTIDFQPCVTMSLSDDCRLQARIEIVTRTNSQQVRTGEYSDDAISVYLVMRRYWGDRPRQALEEIALDLAQRADEICTTHIAPRLLRPISSAIESRS